MSFLGGPLIQEILQNHRRGLGVQRRPTAAAWMREPAAAAASWLEPYSSHSSSGRPGRGHTHGRSGRPAGPAGLRCRRRSADGRPPGPTTRCSDGHPAQPRHVLGPRAAHQHGQRRGQRLQFVAHGHADPLVAYVQRQQPASGRKGAGNQVSVMSMISVFRRRNPLLRYWPTNCTLTCVRKGSHGTRSATGSGSQSKSKRRRIGCSQSGPRVSSGGGLQAPVVLQGSDRLVRASARGWPRAPRPDRCRARPRCWPCRGR